MKTKFLNIIPYIIISLFCFEIFLTPFGSGDELWNYNFAKNIANGLIPYSDISMIQTPLSSYVSAFFLKIFGQGMMVYRTVGYLLMAAIFNMLYKVCYEISKNKITSLLCVFFVLALNSLCFIYNYNYLSVLLVLTIMYLELLNNKTYNNNRNLFVGFLFGLLPLIKQTTGGMLFLLNACICLDFLFKKGKKHLNRLVVSLIPGFFYFIYLLMSSSLDDFFEYAVFGISSFTHKDTFLNYIISSPINLFLGLIPVLIYVYIIYSIVIEKKIDELRLMYMFVSLIWLIFVTFPLCDSSHLFAGIIPTVPLLLLFIKDKKGAVSAVRSISFVTVVVLIVSLLGFAPQFKNYVFSDINNYNGIFMSRKLHQNIKTISKYIDDKEKQGMRVYIADESSAAYTIPLDKYTKNWDMLLVGNLGSSTMEELLDVEENAIFLVLNDEYIPNKQSHFELIHYIKEEYYCFDKVEYFDVYKKE